VATTSKRLTIRKSFFPIAIVIVIFFFLGRGFLKNYSQLSQYKTELNFIYLSVAILFICLSSLLGPFIWKRILSFLGTSLSYRESLKICSLSSLTKYIPGKVWPVLGRVYLTRDRHINENIILTSQGIEWILMILSGILVFLLSIPFGANTAQIEKISWLVILIPFLIILLHPFILQIFVNISSKIFHFDNFTLDINFFNVAEAVLLFSVFWLLEGTAIFFLIKTLIFISPNLLPIAIGFFAISTVVGLLSFLTPAGLGVREGMLVFLLSFYLPTAVIVIVSLLSRICIVSVEFFRAGIITIIQRS
jgi:hypothetical protein